MPQLAQVFMASSRNSVLAYINAAGIPVCLITAGAGKYAYNISGKRGEVEAEGELPFM
jgi:hypothetical protein